LNEAVESKAFPGCSVEIGSSDGPLWRGAFGWFDYSKSAPVTTNAIYDLASLTKVVGTTSVLLRLVAGGKIKLSDLATDHVPEFVGSGTNEQQRAWRGAVTVEHLLTHTGGLPAWKPLYREVSSYPEMIQAIVATPLESEPGARVRYSDLGMMLLGEIASRAASRSLAELERELVFDPLGMRETLRNPPADLLNRIPSTEKLPYSDAFVHGQVHDENARAAEGMTGHAGLFSTVNDLGRFAGEWLRALGKRSDLFPHELAQEFTRRRSEDHSRTLGWGLLGGSENSVFSKGAFGHTGFTGTSIWIDPERDIYVVLLSNRVHPTRDNQKISRVRRELARAIFSRPPDSTNAESDP
jgi:CubicO group peptidase (beta-lactamase class C family)